MWVLIYIFSYSVSPAATNDRAEWRLLPTVVFQEFSSEERCKAAKSKIEATLKQAGDKLKSGLDDLKRAGAADPRAQNEDEEQRIPPRPRFDGPVTRTVESTSSTRAAG